MDCRAACLVAGRRVHGRHPFRGRAAVSSSGVVHKGEGRAAAAGKAAFLKGAPHPACGGASFSQGAWGKGSRGGGAATVAVLACQVVCLVVGHRAVGLRMLGCGDPSAYARRPGKGRPVLHYEGNPTQFLQKNTRHGIFPVPDYKAFYFLKSEITLRSFCVLRQRR